MEWELPTVCSVAADGRGAVAREGVREAEEGADVDAMTAEGATGCEGNVPTGREPTGGGTGVGLMGKGGIAIGLLVLEDFDLLGSTLVALWFGIFCSFKYKGEGQRYRLVMYVL
jgi:hypothetical protein